MATTKKKSTVTNILHLSAEKKFYLFHIQQSAHDIPLPDMNFLMLQRQMLTSQVEVTCSPKHSTKIAYNEAFGVAIIPGTVSHSEIYPIGGNTK